MPPSLSGRNLSSLIPGINISGEMLFYISSKQEETGLKIMEEFKESGYAAETPKSE